MQSCTDEIKAWMCKNQLKLNEHKTEAILFSTPSLSSCHCVPLSIIVGTHEILFSDKVRNLGFILDSACFAPHNEATRNQNMSNSLLWTKTHQLHPQVPYRRRSKTTGNFLCIVQIRLLQFSPYGHSELCNSTDAGSPKYCCTHINLYFKAQRCLSSLPPATPNLSLSLFSAIWILHQIIFITSHITHHCLCHVNIISTTKKQHSVFL